MSRRAKIVSTLGPASSSPAQVAALVAAGQEFTITGEDVPGDHGEVSVSYRGLAGDVRPGTMLESMISAPRPTRAEASDVANAV